MRCAEYFYEEQQANDFKEELVDSGYEGVEVASTFDEEENEPVWAVFWIPKPLSEYCDY